MKHRSERTQLLIGDPGLERLKHAHVLVAGRVWALMQPKCFAGRASANSPLWMPIPFLSAISTGELIALSSTVGRPKSELMGQRLLDINPDLKLHVIHDYLKDEKIDTLFRGIDFDYVVDAIDTIAPKVFFIYTAIQQLRLVRRHGCRSRWILPKSPLKPSKYYPMQVGVHDSETVA